MTGDDEFGAILEGHRQSARDAVAQTFSSGVSGIRPLRGGASGALMYRLEAGDRPYVLRIESARDIFRNPERGYACMRTAADAGIAPPLLHADPTTGVALMEFVEPQPLASHPGGAAGLASALGSLLRRLQETPPFPTFGPFLEVVGGMLSYVRGSGLFVDGLLDRHADAFERIAAVYPWDEAALVSGHNDLASTNVLFDGARLWLVDWELAFRNDAVSDIANLAHYVAPTPELEADLLRGWLGTQPDETTVARFTLMKQLTRLFTACLVLGVSVGQREPDRDLDAPSLAGLREEVVSGQRRIAAAETRFRYGKVLLGEFRRALDDPAFDAALATVA